jgi:hypothetical protein
MGEPARDGSSLSGLERLAGPINDDGKHSRSDATLLVFREMDVHRRPLPVRGQRALELEPHLVPLRDAPERQPLAGMAVLENQAHGFIIGQDVPALGI